MTTVSRRPPLGRCTLFACATVLLWTTTGAAQTAPFGGGPDVPAFASAWLPPGHWAEDAMRRLYGMGLLDTYDPALRRITEREAAAAFQEGLRRASTRRPEALDLVRGWQVRFAEEFRGTVELLERGITRDVRYHGAAAAAYDVRENDVLTTSPADPDLTGRTTPLRDDSRFRLAGYASLTWAPYAAIGYTGQEPRLEGGDTRELYASGRWRSLGLWLGRRAPGYGPGVSGAIVVQGEAQMDGGGLFLADPVRLPVLGPVRVEMSLARLGGERGIEDPWFWTARGSLQPHPRFGIGVSRGAMFGGEGGEPLTLENLLFLAIGKHGSGGSNFENQIAAVDLWARPPLGSLPLLAYLDWGFEDSAGAWKDMPGIVAGLELASVPGLAPLSVGAEWSDFPESCCSNPAWYRHMGFTQGWTEDGRPLAHPLGGHGTEGAVFARLSIADARARISARVFQRDRGIENLYAPERVGTSTGGTAELLLRWSASLEITVEGYLENGDNDWRETYGSVGARLLF